MAVRVLLVDDDERWRKTCRILLRVAGDLEIAGEAENGREGCDMARSLKPDVVVMDISMPVMDGRKALKELTACMPDLPVVMLSMHCEPSYIRGCQASGARGYVLKDRAAEDLVDVIRNAVARGPFLSPGSC
jgi:DNA-binding NarL/FixJ family response regulator